jgi:TetR/AcrR family transcriptional regulator, transcriptional repressor for nem operon
MENICQRHHVSAAPLRARSFNGPLPWRNGCLIGNFSAEASEHSEVIRKRLIEIYEEMRRSVASCLIVAVKIGEVPRKTECDKLAGFLIASLQGAILQSKAERSAIPLERFKHLIFSTLLR